MTRNVQFSSTMMLEVVVMMASNHGQLILVAEDCKHISMIDFSFASIY